MFFNLKLKTLHKFMKRTLPMCAKISCRPGRGWTDVTETASTFRSPATFKGTRPAGASPSLLRSRRPCCGRGGELWKSATRTRTSRRVVAAFQCAIDVRFGSCGSCQSRSSFFRGFFAHSGRSLSSRRASTVSFSALPATFGLCSDSADFISFYFFDYLLGAFDLPVTVDQYFFTLGYLDFWFWVRVYFWILFRFWFTDGIGGHGSD